MKKATKPAPKAPARKASTTKQSAAEPKTKSSAMPKPRKAQDQADLLSIVERLAQAAERLIDATTGGPAARAHEATTQPPIPSYDHLRSAVTWPTTSFLPISSSSSNASGVGANCC